MEMTNEMPKMDYQKPAMKTYTEQELLMTIEAWGSGGVPYSGTQ